MRGRRSVRPGGAPAWSHLRLRSRWRPYFRSWSNGAVVADGVASRCFDRLSWAHCCDLNMTQPFDQACKPSRAAVSIVVRSQVITPSDRPGTTAFSVVE